MSDNLNIKVQLEGKEQAKGGLNDIGKAGKQAGKDIEHGSNKGKDGLDNLDKQSNKTKKGVSGLTNSIEGFKTKILAVIGVITTLIRLLKSWYDHLKKISDAQREIAEQAKGLDAASKALASQAGVMGTETGIKASRQQILQIMQGGNLSDFSLAEGVAVSTHSAFGTKGQALTDNQIGIASTVADFAQRKGISSGGVDQLFKVLAAMGVSDQQSAQGAIQKISSVQQASKAKTFEQFISGGVKSLIPAIAMGASPERALADFATTLNAAPSADVGATTSEQLMRLLQNTDAIAGMTKGTGMSEKMFRNLPYDQKMSLLDKYLTANAATGEGQMALQDAGLTAEQMKAAVTLYNSDNISARDNFMRLGLSSTASEFANESAGWRKTTLGLVESFESQKAVASAITSNNMRKGAALLDLSNTVFKQYNQAGMNDFLIPDGQEKQNFIANMFYRQYMASVGKPVHEMSKEQRDAYYDVASLYYDKDNPLTPEIAGKAISSFENVTGLNAPTVINHYMAPIYNRLDAGSQPRVSPAD